MKIRQTFALLISLSISVFAEPSTQAPAVVPAKPNIVLFFVDDYGWADMGSRQPDVFESPNIDALQKAGIDFQQTYIPCPTCSPSRATLLTGKHPTRLKFFRHIYDGAENGFDEFARTDREFGILETDPAQVPSRNWLPLQETTYAEALKELGYYNMFVGKWHLGSEEYHPTQQGFDRQFGTSNAGHPKSYYPPYFKNSTVLAEEKERYLTDKLTDGAVEFIEQYDEKNPFMLSFWYYSVHGPHVPRKDLFEHFKGKGLSVPLAKYAAMVAAVDESIGRVQEALEKKGVAENTVVILLSDQGGQFDNPPFRGGKKTDTLYEGGARVPFFVYWPGVTKPDESNDSIVQSNDLFPTLVEMAGGDPKEFKDLDGVSLLSTIKDNSTLHRGEPIFGYRAYEDLYISVRSGDWKLLGHRSGKAKLYNLANDIAEEHDIALANPEKVSELKAMITGWEKKMGVEKYSGFKQQK
ncbi:MAG: sulfatase [Luteolibacter sp.]